jgi:DNA-binding transcriptional MerR regulator
MTMKLEVKAVAEALNITGERVRQLEREGVIHAEKTTAGTRLFDPAEVQRVKKEREKKGR